jgi:hypothetical protein
MLSGYRVAKCMIWSTSEFSDMAALVVCAICRAFSCVHLDVSTSVTKSYFHHHLAH